MIIDYSVGLGVNRDFGTGVCRGIDGEVKMPKVDSV